MNARLARRPEDCLWASHPGYLAPRHRPDGLTCSELVGLFGSVESRASYIEGVRLGRSSAPAGFDSETLWRRGMTGAVPFP